MKTQVLDFTIALRRLLHTLDSVRHLNARKIAFFYHFLRRLTSKKCLNILRVEFSCFLKRSQKPGLPYILVIDPTNICNLHCPLCPTGLGKSGRPKGMMRFETFKIAIDQLSEYAIEVIIYNWGEPLLNKKIYDMIRYAAEQNITTHISTNLTLLTEESAEKLVGSGLEHLRVSIDGVSQKTYSSFRYGGNYHQVMSNLRLLIETRNRLKSRSPLIDWYFLVTRYNEHEIQEAKKIARGIKVDHIHFVRVLPVDTFHNVKLHFLRDKSDSLAAEWLPINKIFRYNQERSYLYAGHCPWLWKYTVINYDGSIAPCCYIDNQNADMGNILENRFDAIWNNEAFDTSRQIFKKSSNSEQKSVCYQCDYYRNSRHLE